MYFYTNFILNRVGDSFNFQNKDCSSSSDSNCSFHSAKPSLISSSSSDSFRDLDKNLSNWSLNEIAEKTWSECLWSRAPPTYDKPGNSLRQFFAHENKKIDLFSGSNILQFFTDFSTAARHLIYSILIGRTVVLAGPKHQKFKAVEMTLALAPLIPGRSSTSILT